jgi:sigma-B regulation protein RsbU (phosphoserine phosphatase)
MPTALMVSAMMSAVGIHAAEVDNPAEVLRRTHRAIISELETTEMYVTLFYGVIDPQRGVLTYANAGHSHAFLVSADGEAQRLAATNPPLGIVDLDDYRAETHGWRSGADLLFLFTDGLSDALGLGEVDGGRVLVELVARYRDEPLPELLERVYAAEPREHDLPADDRTAVLVRL